MNEALNEIRRWLDEARTLMTPKGLPEEERAVLEQSLAGLHSAERALLLLDQPRAGEEFAKTVAYLKQLSQQMRELSKVFNRQAKALEQSKKLIQAAAALLQGIAVWR